MGFVDSVLETVTLRSLAILLLVGLIARSIVQRVHEHIRIRRLGNYGHVVPSWAPLGLDLVVESVRHTKAATYLELWRDVYFGHGWTSETRVLNQRIIFTADPVNIKAILATQFGDYGKGEPFHEEWKDFLGDSIFATDGAQWHTSRNLIRPSFTKDRVSDLDCFESHVQTLFRAIANGGPLNGEHQHVDLESANGRVLDISELLFRYTLDVTTEFLLGADTKSLTTPRNEFAEAFNEIQRVQNLITRASRLRHFIYKPTFWSGLNVLNNFVNQYIDRALALSPEELAKHSKSDKGYTFLHELAGFTRDRKVLRDQMVAILLAGRDTTASTMSWALYELSKNPAAVGKLRREILDTVGTGLDDKPTYEHVKNMPYLKAVLNETLRLYPSVPFNVRLALKDTTLPRGGGPDGSEPLPVLKNTPVAYSTLVMQRRADLYPPVSDTFADPAVFSPDRWLHWHPKPHDYIPFNAGPRICIGQQFALTEMSYVLCRLLQRFETVESHMWAVDGGRPNLKADIVLSPGKGVHIAFRDPQN